MITFTYLHPDDISTDKLQRISIMIQCGTKWLWMKENEDNGVKLIDGFREEAETPMQAARRILSEHRSILLKELKEVCPYLVEDGSFHYNGMLLFASISDLSFEKNTAYQLFEKLPENLSEPIVSKRLFTGTQGWLNMQTNADELWDVYDKNRNLTGKLHRRGDFLKKGEYHLVVHIWLLNSKGEFLLTKRAPNKGFPLCWETSGGAAQAGDDSLTAALREVREETGLIASADFAEKIYSFRREDDFCDVWLIRQDFCLNDVVLLEGETVDKRYADIETVLKLYHNKELVPYSYLEDFFSKIK